ncbi:MAG: TetR/AcrR family transcriptional regulator [Bacteroidales bacterium]
MKNNTDSELKILEAAEKVFYRKGKHGTSMQDIADEAGITRTSLNYYYRTKDKLFEAVFRNAMTQFVPKLAELINSGVNFTEYLSKMVEVVIDIMLDKPQIPVFVLQELTSNPDRVPQLITELGLNSVVVSGIIKKDSTFRDLQVNPVHLIINVLSLCIFPFAAKPMLVTVMFNGNEEEYIHAMKERKALIPEMIENMIKTLKP